LIKIELFTFFRIIVAVEDLNCSKMFEHLRHSDMHPQKFYIPEKSLQTLGIPYTKFHQRPGEIVVTMPQAIFQCVNLGYCLDAKISFIVDIPKIDKYIHCMLQSPTK